MRFFITTPGYLGRVRFPLLALAAAVVLVAPARAGGPTMLIGAAEDQVKQQTLTETKAKLDLLRLVGLNAVRVTSIWDPDNPAPGAEELSVLRNLVSAADLDGMDVFVAVYNFGSKTTPLTDDQQASFASHAATLAREVPGLRDFIIGNEPNLNRFWMPQFNPDGTDAAAPAYLSLLYRTYQALKGVDPQIRVFGGAISPRGVDRPGTGRDTHSPTVFIEDLGDAYRMSGLTSPVMDALAIHPYPENSSIPPTLTHPNTTPIGIADYAKLEGLLAHAFDGTAQPGSTLPILYAEYGVESQIPAEKAGLYTGTEPATIKPVPEPTQGASYRQAIALSFCQPNVMGLFLFHAIDEPALDRFQSGLYYTDTTPKSSLTAVRQAVRDAHGGVIARCQGLALTPKARVVYPRISTLATGAGAIAVNCDIDCNVYARLEKLPMHSTTLVARATAPAAVRTLVPLRRIRLARGRYRFTVRLTAPVNTGEPLALTSKELTVQ
jgi:hypothetical protein